MKAKVFGKACLLGGALVQWGVTGAFGAEDSSAKLNFADHVMPVLESACVSCHNPDQGKGGLDLTSYAATMTGGSGGQIVQPGNPERSRLYTLTAHLEEPQMPPGKPKIEQAKLDVLKRWIEDGLLESKGSKAKKASGPVVAAVVETSGERPKEPAMPKHLLLQPEVVAKRGTAVTALGTSPWAPLLAVGGQKQVLLYRTEPQELLGILPFPEGFPEAISFSRNGGLLLAGGGRGGKSGNAVAWDVKTGQRVVEVGREFDAALAADISPDHRLVVLGGPGRNIKIYDAQTGEQLHSIKKHPDWLLKVKFSPDGVLFASGGRNGEIFVWEAETGIEFYELADHQKPITGLSWRADSNVMASSSEDGNVVLWEMQNGKQMKKWAAHPGGALAVHFSPDGSRLVTGGRDKTVKIWNLNGALQREIKGFSDIVTAVAFTHDGKQVISGDWQGELRLWDAGSGVEQGRFEGNPPRLDVQLARAQKQVQELESKLPALEQAAASAVAAAAGALKNQDAAGQAFALAKKELADAEQMTKRGEQMLADAAAKVKAAAQAQDAARRSVDEARSSLDKARAQIGPRRSKLAELDSKLAALPQELAAVDKQLEEAGARSRQAAQVREAARKALQGAEFELEQLKGNPSVEARVGAARKALELAGVACVQAEGVLKECTAKRAALAQARDAMAQAREEENRAIKAAELVLSQQPEVLGKAERQLAETAARLAEARALEKASQDRVAEAKKILASSAGLPKQREEAAKTAKAALAEAQAREAAAKDALGRAQRELAYARYLVEKWRAAQVNLKLHSESESLGTLQEQFAQMNGKAEAAVESHRAAVQAVAQAEETLRKARAVVQRNTAVVDSATDQVVKTGLKVLAAGFADGTAGKTKSSGAGSAEQAPELRKELDKAASEAKQTLAELEQASRAAKETPPLIDERVRLRDAREAEMKMAMDQVRQQELKVREKSSLVESLRKEYEVLYREWGQGAPGEAK